MCDPELVHESHRLLDRARMIAEAPAAVLSPGRSHPASRPPGGFSLERGTAFERSTLQALGDEINAAIKTDDDRRLAGANKHARDELDAIAHGAPDRGPETPDQFRYRINHDYEGQTASFVARREMSSITTVRKLRVEDRSPDAPHGRDAARGHPLPSPDRDAARGHKNA